MTEMLGVEGRPMAADPADPADPAHPDEGDHIRPNIVVSQCLGFAAVRYNGQVLRSGFVEALRDHVHFIQVCPEVGIGLGVPRDPIHIEEGAGEGSGGPSRRLRLVQPASGRDVTDDMHAFADRLLGGMVEVDGFILKAKSPSCGLVDTKIFGPGSESEPLRRGPGLFGAAVTEAFPWAAIQDEARLTNPGLRHRFLTHLWALARLRSVRTSGRIERLARYHASYELTLRALGPEVPIRLGRIVDNPDRRAFDDLVLEYRRALGRAFRIPPEPGHTVHALADIPATGHFFRPYPGPLFDGHGSGDGRRV